MSSRTQSFVEDVSIIHALSQRNSVASANASNAKLPPSVIPIFDTKHSNEERPRATTSEPQTTGSGSQPPYPYPNEESFTANERAHFAWYGDPERGKASPRHGQQLEPNTLGNSLKSYHDRDGIEKLDHISPLPSGSYGEHLLPPPDGGKQAWLHVLAGFLVILNAQDLNMSFGIFQVYYQTNLHLGSTAKIAWIGPVQNFFLFLMSLIVAPAAERGLLRPFFHGGSLLLFLATLGTSYCTKWWQFFVLQGVGTGIAMGSIFASGLLILLGYFSKRLATATGIAPAGAPAGGILFPLVARAAIEPLGFGWTVRIVALVNLASLAVANVIIRPRTRTPPAPAGAIANLTNRPASTDPKPNHASFPLLTAGLFLTFLGFYITLYFLPTYAQQSLPLSAPTTSLDILITTCTANLLARLLPSLLADTCLGPLNTLIPSTLLTSLFALCWIATTTATGLFIAAGCYGFASAACRPCTPLRW